MSKRFEKILAMFLALVMVIGLVPMQTFAADTTPYVAQIGETKYETLQAAINAVKNGETITFLTDIDESVTIKQVKNVSFTIDGENKTYKGTMTVNGTGYASDQSQGLTIQNVNFVVEDYGIYAYTKNNYARNITVDGCSFTGTDGDNLDYGIAMRHVYNITVKNTTGTNLFDLVYGGGSLTGFKAENITVTNSKNGIWLSYVNSTATFKNLNMTGMLGSGIGIKNGASGTVTIEDCNIKAAEGAVTFEPYDNVKTKVTLVFKGTNNLTNDEGNWFFASLLNQLNSDSKVTVNLTEATYLNVNNISYGGLLYRAVLVDENVPYVYTFEKITAPAITWDDVKNQVSIKGACAHLDGSTTSENLGLETYGTLGEVTWNGTSFTCEITFNLKEALEWCIDNVENCTNDHSLRADSPETITYVATYDSAKSKWTITDGPWTVQFADIWNVTYNFDCTKPITYVAQIGETKYETLQAAINAVKNGETITFLTDIDESVTIKQVKNVSFTIDGANKTYQGTMTVNGTGYASDQSQGLTIQNVKFVVEGYGIYAYEKNNYARNITVDGCSFTGTDGDNLDYGIAMRHVYNITVKNTTGTNLFDLVYGGGSLTGFKAENITVTNSKNGIWLSYVNSTATFKNLNMTGIRSVGVGIKNGATGTVTIEDCTIEAADGAVAFEPYDDANNTKKVTIVFKGENTLTNDEGNWFLANLLDQLYGSKVIVNLTEATYLDVNNISYGGLPYRAVLVDANVPHIYTFEKFVPTITLDDVYGLVMVQGACNHVDGTEYLKGTYLKEKYIRLGDVEWNDTSYTCTVTFALQEYLEECIAEQTCTYDHTLPTDSPETIEYVVTYNSAKNKWEYASGKWDVESLGVKFVTYNFDCTKPVTYVAQIGDVKYETLQAAINAVKSGETITFLTDINESVTIKQVKNVSFTIDGAGKTYTGTMTVNGTGYASDQSQGLTIQNVNFVVEGYGIYAYEKNNYARNITVDGCSFTGTDGDNLDYGIALRHVYNITVKNTTGTNLFDLVYGGGSLTGFEAENITVTNSKNGIWLSYVNSTATFKDLNMTDILSVGIGIKNGATGTVTIEDCNIAAADGAVAFEPYNDTTNTKKVTFVFKGTNKLTNNEGNWFLANLLNQLYGSKVIVNLTEATYLNVNNISYGGLLYRAVLVDENVPHIYTFEKFVPTITKNDVYGLVMVQGACDHLDGTKYLEGTYLEEKYITLGEVTWNGTAYTCTVTFALQEYLEECIAEQTCPYIHSVPDKYLGTVDYVVTYNSAKSKWTYTEYVGGIRFFTYNFDCTEPVAEIVETGKKYESLQEAINACTNGETIKLLVDITYTADDVVSAHGGGTGFGKYDAYNPAIIYTGGIKGATDAQNQPSNVNAVLDLNGHTITNNADAYLFMIMDNAKLTFKDSVGTGSITSTTETPVIWAVGTDTLVTIESGEYTTASDTGLLWSTHGADMVIAGGVFETTADDASMLIVRNEQDRNNANYFVDGKATVTITGGTFDYNPEKTNDDYTATVFNACADGYYAIDNGNGTWTVSDDYVEWIKAELLAGRDVTLAKDIVVDGHYIDSIPAATNSNGKYPNYGIFNVYGDTVTFNLNGHTITYNGHVTFEWNGETYNSCTVAHGLFMANDGGNLTIVDSVGTGKVDVHGVASGVYSCSPNSVITVKGGTWTNDGCATCDSTNLFLYASHGGELYITGGTFEKKADPSYLIVEQGGEYKNAVIDFSKTKIEVSGGHFIGMNPEEAKYFYTDASNVTTHDQTTNVVAEGYYALKCTEHDNCWIIGEAVAMNVNTGKGYGDVSDALDDAKSGETVKLLVSTLEEDILMVPAGVTLDLNGQTIVVNYAVVAFGHIIDTAEVTGGIKISTDVQLGRTTLLPNNKYLPIYDTVSGCYKFYEYELRILGTKFSTDNSKLTLGYQLLFNNAEAYKVISETDYTGINLKVTLTWEGRTGADIVYTFTDQIIKEYATEMYDRLTNPENPKYEQTTLGTNFSITGINVLETGTTLNATLSVVSATNVEASKETDTVVIP